MIEASDITVTLTSISTQPESCLDTLSRYINNQADAGALRPIAHPEHIEPIDCISRQLALSHSFDNENKDFISGVESYKEWLKGLPSCESHRVCKWVRTGSSSLIDPYKCSGCHSDPPKRQIREHSTWGWNFTPYCPNCGAMMIGIQD